MHRQRNLALARSYCQAALSPAESLLSHAADFVQYLRGVTKHNLIGTTAAIPIFCLSYEKVTNHFTLFLSGGLLDVCFIPLWTKHNLKGGNSSNTRCDWSMRKWLSPLNLLSDGLLCAREDWKRKFVRWRVMCIKTINKKIITCVIRIIIFAWPQEHKHMAYFPPVSISLEEKNTTYYYCARDS